MSEREKELTLHEPVEIAVPFPLPPESPKLSVCCLIMSNDQLRALLPYGLRNGAKNALKRKRIETIPQLLSTLNGSKKKTSAYVQEVRTSLEHFSRWLFEERVRNPGKPIIVNVPACPRNDEAVLEFLEKWPIYRGENVEGAKSAAMTYFNTTIETVIAISRRNQSVIG